MVSAFYGTSLGYPLSSSRDSQLFVLSDRGAHLRLGRFSTAEQTYCIFSTLHTHVADNLMVMVHFFEKEKKNPAFIEYLHRNIGLTISLILSPLGQNVPPLVRATSFGFLSLF